MHRPRSRETDTTFTASARWREHRAGLGKPEAGFPPIDLEGLPQGTVGAVALDDHGVLACATSTGGKTNKNGESRRDVAEHILTIRSRAHR